MRPHLLKLRSLSEKRLRVSKRNLPFPPSVGIQVYYFLGLEKIGSAACLVRVIFQRQMYPGYLVTYFELLDMQKTIENPCHSRSVTGKLAPNSFE
jgi:hypothetical protein